MDICQVIFFAFLNTHKKNQANIQPSWPNKFGQQSIYYMAK